MVFLVYLHIGAFMYYVCIRVERDITRHWVKYISKISRFISSKRIVCFIVCFFFFFFVFSLLVNHLTLINGKYVPIIYVICMYIYTHMFVWYARGNSSCLLLWLLLLSLRMTWMMMMNFHILLILLLLLLHLSVVHVVIK